MARSAERGTMGRRARGEERDDDKEWKEQAVNNIKYNPGRKRPGFFIAEETQLPLSFY